MDSQKACGSFSVQTCVRCLTGEDEKFHHHQSTVATSFWSGDLLNLTLTLDLAAISTPRCLLEAWTSQCGS